jgi:hypothetical protein
MRLTVNGKSYTQPISVHLDPRVKTAAAGLAQLAMLTRTLHDEAVSTWAAYTQARALSAKLEQASGADVAAFKAAVDSLAPPSSGGGRGGRGFGGGRGGRGGATTEPRSLETATNALIAAVMPMQSADVTPTASQVATADRARAEAAAVMRQWTTLKTTGLASLNAKLKAAGQPPIALP